MPLTSATLGRQAYPYVTIPHIGVSCYSFRSQVPDVRRDIIGASP